RDPASRNMAWSGPRSPWGSRADHVFVPAGELRPGELRPHQRLPCGPPTESGKKRAEQLDCEQTGLYTSSMGRTRQTSEARQRILETADRLFYQDGIRAVGIDRIIAEANVAKMSLYKHFPSKDDLILAVLKHREEGVLEFFRS